MPRPLAETLRRPACCLATGTCLALTPKCVLCLMAYAGLGTALGLGGPELCGATDGTTGHWITGWPVLAGVMVAGGGLARHFRSRSS